jgi:hypothetical protein
MRITPTDRRFFDGRSQSNRSKAALQCAAQVNRVVIPRRVSVPEESWLNCGATQLDGNSNSCTVSCHSLLSSV